MTDITITVVLKPSSELMLLADALTNRIDRLLSEYQRGGAARRDGDVQVARDDAEPHKATKPEPRDHGWSPGDPDSKAPVLPDPIPQTPHVAAAPQRAAMEAITPAAVAGTVAGGPKAPLPEPTGLALAAQNGGEIENEAPASAAVTCNRLAAGASTKPAKPPVVRQHWCTDERRAVLRRTFATDATPASIVTELRKLPGPPLPNWDGIGSYVNVVLKLKRGTASTKPSVLSRAMQLPKEPIDISVPIPADFDTIRAKAGTWGKQFTSWSDLNAINEHARRIGHRPFSREGRGVA